MSRFRSALHVSAFALLMLVTAAVLHHGVGTAPPTDDESLTNVAAAVLDDRPRDPELDVQLARRAQALSRAAARREARPAPVAPRAVIEPITWTSPMTSYRLTSHFGETSYMWSSGVHTGADFAAPTGTPIRSVADGVVTEASYDGSYGYKTVVTLPDGGEAWYCHQDRLAVSRGQRVEAGQLIGYVGSTGNVTGPHLHMEIRYGDQPVDPLAVLAREGVRL